MRGARTAAGVLALAAGLTGPAARAGELGSPVGLFVEGGLADDARSLVVGAAWTWAAPSRWDGLHWSGYLETSIGEWNCRKSPDGPFRACATQLGLTPVIRFQPLEWTHWYLELGIGLDAILPLYQSDRRQFFTEFNFGDHFGIGRRFGDGGRDEIELRGEHYSNGGYRNPNPGENWLQLRYMHWF